MHYSCDLCGKDMAEGAEERYVLNMEVAAAHDPTALTEDDLDADHLEELGQLIEEDVDLEPTPRRSAFRYDLCGGCHAKFLADPLGREAMKFEFSAN